MSPSRQISHDNRGTIRVLVADPDHDTRTLYGDSLKLAGCDVVDAADGRDALVKALSHRPTLVVTETQLPLFDGYALCEVLRRDSMTRDVPILVVTTEQQPEELDRARAAGADRVLVKPVSPDALLTEVQRLLQHRARPDKADTANDTAGPVSNAGRCKPLAKAHLRFETKTPPVPPPDAVCPTCNGRLVYERSHVGGVSKRHPEQWDYYSCPASCGTFVYRQRTRKLRRA